MVSRMEAERHKPGTELAAHHKYSQSKCLFLCQTMRPRRTEQRLMKAAHLWHILTLNHHMNKMEWKERKKEEGWFFMIRRVILHFHLSFPTFSLNISSPPTCSHTEWGIGPSHSQYLSPSFFFSLLASPLHSGPSLPIAYASCGRKWAHVSPVTE